MVIIVNFVYGKVNDLEGLMMVYDFVLVVLMIGEFMMWWGLVFDYNMFFWLFWMVYSEVIKF